MRIAGLFVVLGAVGAGAALIQLSSFNHFDRVEREFSGQCTPVQGVAGPEDIQIDPRRRLAIVSSLDRRDRGARGAIHIFDLDNPLDDRGWRDRTGGVPVEFEPLGLDYYDNGAVRRLFVVNRSAKSVELFEVQNDGSLVHLKSFTERRLTSPNNVVATGPQSFYVTNDLRRRGPAHHFGGLDFLTRRAGGEIFYTDGAFWRLAADGLRYANGLDLSPDGRKLYVAETSGERIRIFERHEETGALTPYGRILMDAAPDNLMVDGAGVVWVAAAPKPLAIARHSLDSKARAPSAVFRIGADGKARSVYRDDGSELSASSAAARMGNLLLIGALYEEKFLICHLPGGAF